MNTFCHGCRRVVDIVERGNVIECNNCGSGFVEKTSRDISPEFYHGPNNRIPLHRAPSVATLSHMHNAQSPLDRPGASASSSDGALASFMGISDNNETNPLRYQNSWFRRVISSASSSSTYEDARSDVFSVTSMSEDDFSELMITEDTDDERSTSFGRFRLHSEGADLSRIPMTQVTPKQVDDGMQCPTCMELFQLNQEVARLDCSHIFHRPCIMPWLQRRLTCPICRKIVSPKKWTRMERMLR
ncbi:ring finger domain-containing protein [Ditylenchus destructor]|uniref:RING-type E3 ubiquitin transferase n=1 Tax=Ditylenchus destructor TaxID=166010 RepID=A0AAD4N778_9BILA|nr:ring finger domain-containing protein [Ditylenchus destructor]